MDNRQCPPGDEECIYNNEEFDLLTDFVNSDEIDIYTATAIIVKNYNESGSYIRWIIISFICFITQLLIPIFVIIDIIEELRHEEGICPKTAPWQIKATSVVMCLFLALFYLRKWEPLISRFIFKSRDKQKATNAITLLFLRNLEHYMSEGIFMFGIIANILALCINTCTGLFIIFSSKSALDLSIDCMVLYYFNDIIKMFVDDNLKAKCTELLRRSNQKINAKKIQDEHTYKKWFDSHVSMITSIFMMAVFPLLSISILLLILGGLVFLPLCHP
jgi:hypothetical protein